MPRSPRSWSLRSSDHQRPAPTLNAIATPAPDTDEQATARHLVMCRRLAELGMNLAESAAREAERNLVAPLEYPVPGTALEPLCRTGDPGLLFTRLARAVRQTISLECRIRADAFDRPRPRPRPAATTSHTPATSPKAPPSRPPAAQRPIDPVFRPESDACDEDEFAGDHDRPIAEIVADIRRDLNLPAEKPSRQRKPSLHATAAFAPPPPGAGRPGRRPHPQRPPPHPD